MGVGFEQFATGFGTILFFSIFGYALSYFINFFK